ncbi:MAG: TetR/AcrR family transcriptional regulator [Bacteroidales bacterium]
MSPRTLKQYEEIREEKKNLIMKTALEHFARNGYYVTTIQHIAKHAGISKGLLYNYFPGKEALLKEIIEKSVREIYKYFDINHDGFLTGEEFEYFIRKIYRTLKEKKIFWRLFFQILMQKEVREQYVNLVKAADQFTEIKGDSISGLENYILRVLTDYFKRKKGKMGNGYNPETDLTMFMFILKGFSVSFIFNDDESAMPFFEKAVDRIIDQYK